ncbi:MAG: cytochrome c biogenesis CcdA family protein [Ilumatobacter fluminis]|uniref:cytochrome c biogenesis CcdA family protein n=1 Tax=Ilumatobacter fluminis TaxID=467091 RepID=UPI0032EB5E1B
MTSSTLALAFTAGMVATFNPCGFSLLPAYLGAFVAGDEVETSTERRLARAAGVSAAVAIGFVVVFASVGLVIDRIASETQQQLPWVTITIGGLLVLFGVATLAGWRPKLPIAVPDLAAGRSGFLMMVGYGITFAIASLSCTIGPFLAVTGTALRGTAWDAATTYVAYALGMGLIVLLLSLSAAAAHSSIAANLRKFSRWAPRVGGALMVIAGAYAIWYGRWELAVYDGQLGDDPVVDRIENVRLRVVAEIQRIGAAQLVLLAAAITIGVIIWSRIRSGPASRHGSIAGTSEAVSPGRSHGDGNAGLNERNASECV